MQSLHLRSNQIKAERGYIPGLDGLRAVSVSIVVLGHFFLGKYLGFSALGLYIFFAISGFLITRLLFAELTDTADIAIGKFYFRRFLRLYPVLTVYMLTIIVIALQQGDSIGGPQIASVFFYFTNYFQSWNEFHQTRWTLPIGPLWSLSVEEHFYILAPLFIVFVKGRIKPMLIFSAVMCIVPLLIRCVYVDLWPQVLGTTVLYRLSETRFDSIAWGMLLATLCETRQRERIVALLASRKAMATGLALLLLSYAIRNLWFVETLRYTLRSAGVVPLIAGAVFSTRIPRVQQALNAAAVRWVGRLSYSLYIWHSGASTYLKLLPLQVRSSMFNGVMLLTITVVLACLSYYLIEQPFLKLRHRPAQRSRALASS